MTRILTEAERHDRDLILQTYAERHRRRLRKRQPALSLMRYVR